MRLYFTHNRAFLTTKASIYIIFIKSLLYTHNTDPPQNDNPTHILSNLHYIYKANNHFMRQIISIMQ